MRDTLSLGKALAAIGFFLVAGIGSWWMAASEGFLMYAVAVVCFGFVAFGSGALLLDAWRRIRGPRRDPFPAGHAPDLSADPSGSGFARGGAESPFTTDPFDPTGVPPGADASSFPHKPLRGMPMRVARATLEGLVEAGVLAPLTDSETERVLAGLPDAEMETILATVQELLGERPGDAFPLWDQVEQNEEYVTDLVDGFARLSGMPIRMDELVIDRPPDGVRRTRLRLVLQLGVGQRGPGQPGQSEQSVPEAAGPSGSQGQEPMRFGLDTLIWRKDLSPVVPVRVARALREAGAPRRLAVHWLMAMWVIALADDSELARVNELLGPPDPDTETSFVWLDELELDPDEY